MTAPSGVQLEAVRARRMVTMDGAGRILDDGALIFDADTEIILEVGPWTRLRRAGATRVLDLGEATLTPGLLNVHTHLELSHLAGRTVLGRGFETWMTSLVALLAEEPDEASLRRAAQALRETGTVYAADIATRHPLMARRAMEDAGLAHHAFVEFFGYAPPEGGLPWRRTLPAEPSGSAGRNLAAAGHALYSTHPETLRQAKAWDTARGLPFAMHLAEHPGELEVLRDGTGAFAQLLKRRVLPDGYQAPGLSPVAYADRLGLLDQRTLAVHCVHVDDTDIALLRLRGAAVCLCPRSNVAIGVGLPPLARLRAAGLTICLGTDSLASNDDLSLWKEALLLLEKSESHITVSEALEWMTTNPARVMGQARLGSLEPGKLARWAVAPPAWPA